MFATLLLVSLCCYSGFSDGMIWNEISMKNQLQPSGCYKAQCWVDDKDQLWLYGGMEYILKNGSNILKSLHDIWQFDPMSYKWHKIMHLNSSYCPEFVDRGLTTYCLGHAYVFAHQMHEKRDALWAYNQSSKSWKVIVIPRGITMQKCFAMLCNETLKTITIFCDFHNSSVLWLYDISTDVWSSLMFTKSNKNSTSLDHYSTWNDNKGVIFTYAWYMSGEILHSHLFVINNSHVKTLLLNNTGIEYVSNRNGFLRWVDTMGNLHLLGGKTSEFSTVNSTKHWSFNMLSLSWKLVHSTGIEPRPRIDSCFWQVHDQLWMFGGYYKDSNGRIVILRDIWRAVLNTFPVTNLQTSPSLPGDTLGLSITTKLIISIVTLCVVMVISVRVCYKRELNLLLSKLSKQRVVYHQVSQEVDNRTGL